MQLRQNNQPPGAIASSSGMIRAMGIESAMEGVPTLVITADDFGYRGAYDAGIVVAARAGAIDRVSVMAVRASDIGPLLELDIALGLHIEADAGIAAQLRAFEELAGRPPAYLDGHRHCHAEPRIAADLARVAAELGIPVRAVNPGHRAQLRQAGVATTDRLVGRLFEHQPPLPAEIARWHAGERVLPGTTEWFVHPGFRDPDGGSSYDAGRPEDLALLLELGDRERWRRAGVERSTLAASAA
jgi:predicted glycoside hydrolase/deacetylase ChbG (UPF0249 family)